jgi:hypothetical protein
MARGGEVLEMLMPTGGWVIYGDDFDSIIYSDGVKPITKKQFEDGFAVVDSAKSAKETADAIAKQSILDRLGITADEAALLLK